MYPALMRSNQYTTTNEDLLTRLKNKSQNYIRNIIAQNYQEPDLLGDVNGDTLINVQDVILVINLVLNPILVVIKKSSST